MSTRARKGDELPLDGRHIARLQDKEWWRVIDTEDENREVFKVPSRFPRDLVAWALVAFLHGRNEGERLGDARRLDAVHRALQLGAYAPQPVTD